MANEKKFEKFDILGCAKLAFNYLTTMVDKNVDDLPYWLVVPHAKPAYAKHCRVDDAELVASWYEAIVAIRQMLGTEEGKEVESAFYRHLMKSWGKHGLRFHEPYPWTHTNHSSFHEMGYVLSALNRILINNPANSEAEKHASQLVRGLKALAIHRQVKTFWSGDIVETEPVYEFPNDVFLNGAGFDLTRHTGRGEQAIRNGVLLLPLVERWHITGDEVALDLAKGIANHLLGVSRYFNYKMEFFGHVHSSVWVASGLVKLGRLMNENWYIQKGKGIFDYVLSISSSFGWVPEYAQWRPEEEEYCETCCIKDMIQCGSELIAAGYEEYWEILNRYSRNQLVENQIKDGSFVPVDNSMADTVDTTYQDIDQRTVGGFSGGADPNCISLKRFRSVAGCCVGTAPQAFQIIWDLGVNCVNNTVVVNIPFDKTLKEAEVITGYPNEGFIRVKLMSKMDVTIRVFDWMKEDLKGYVNGWERDLRIEGNLITFTGLSEGDRIELKHELSTVAKKERVKGVDYTLYWRGADVVDISPKGDHIRLYQRESGVPKYYPRPEDIGTVDASVVAVPSEQKK